jgi:hypothetical protein
MRHALRGSIWTFCLISLVLFAACGKKTGEQAKESGSGATPKIAAVEETFNFGQIKQGTDVEHVFKIKNNGNAELLIKKARGS